MINIVLWGKIGFCPNLTKEIGRSYLKYFLAAVLLIFTITGYSTDYYVSSVGNDSNSGTSPDQPWKSLEKVNSFNPVPGDRILFKRGDEWSGAIKVNGSGIAGSAVVYGSYGTGDNPKIYGSAEIKGWELHEGNIYKATFDSNIEQLFINNKRARLARYPNSGYFKITGVNSSSQFTSKDLDSGINYEGATWIGRTSAFTMFSKPVTSSSSQTLTLKSIPTYRLGTDEGFFLADKLEFLDEAGEWYYDASAGTVYFWSPNGNSPDNYPVRGSISAYGIYISDKNYIEIKDFEILHSSETGIHINNSSNITVENNRILSPDLVGIHIPAGKSNAVKLKNNYIYQANGSGIRCYSSSSTITDNIIENTGLLENINKSTFKHDNFGTGAFVRGNNINFNYNRIINSGYCGVNFKGKKTMIKYNFIDGACQVLDDGGGIYSYNRKIPTASSGSEIMHNIVLNVHGNRLGYTDKYDVGYGIYMDEETTDVLIKHNTISQVSCGLFVHDAGNIIMQNNTIFDALLGCRASGEYSNSYIYDNIFYGVERNGDFTWWTNRHQMFQVRDSSTPVYNNNRYINPYNTQVFSAGTFLSFLLWKLTTLQDLNSVFDGSPLAEGESEKLIYNDTKQTKTVKLGNSGFRDIDGNKVSEKLTLEPFTSKILIGTNFDVLDEKNQAPVILDQSFNIVAPIQANDLVGQVDASDPDTGQILDYFIVQGNETGLFTIDPFTGEINAGEDILSVTDTSIVLFVEVTDNAINSLSSGANVTINITGMGESQRPGTITAPTISSFTIPSTATSLTIPVSSFEVADEQTVAGYLLTETSNAPSVSDSGWTATAPASYTFSHSGTKILYAWVKDSAGNVSEPLSGTVEITLPNSVVEYVSICEGEDYLGWTEPGEYEHILTQDTTIEARGENLITNSNFSNGTDGWRTWGATGYNLDLSLNTLDYVSAPASLQVRCTANGLNDNALHLITGGNIAVEEGKEYELTFYAKATVELSIEKMYIFKGTFPWTKYGFFESMSTQITKNWNQYKLKFTATGSASDAQVRIYLGKSLPSGQSLYIDDFTFSEIAEEKVTNNQLVITYLTVNPAPYSTEEVTITEGEEYMGWTEPGEYERTLTSSAGCDSTVITILLVEQNIENQSDDSLGLEVGWKDNLTKSAVADSSKVGDNSASQVQNNHFSSVDISANSETENEFKLYPNPAFSFITVEYSFLPEPGTSVEILNSSGQTVYNQKVSSLVNHIDVFHLPPGFYYIRSKDNQKGIVKKLIIK